MAGEVITHNAEDIEDSEKGGNSERNGQIGLCRSKDVVRRRRNRTQCIQVSLWIRRNW